MTPVTNKRIIFKEYPTDLPIAGPTTVLDAGQSIDLENAPLNGGILVKTLGLSLEPYIVCKMKPDLINSYTIGEPAADRADRRISYSKRFIACGMVTGYSGSVPPVASFLNVVTKDITIYGFRLFSLMSKYKDDFSREVPALLASKELAYRESVTDGLENAEKAFVNLMTGEFIGKRFIL